MPMHAERDIVTANPSVRLSVTLWYCIETNAHIVKLFPPSGRGMTSFFLSATAVTKFQGELPQRGIKYMEVVENLRFSTEIAVHLGNGTR